MSTLLNINNLFLLDAFFFIIVSMIVLINPNPTSQLRDIPPEDSLPAHKDTRRLLAPQFLTVSILLAFIGLSVHTSIINLAALMRALSLIILVINQFIQISHKRWKPMALSVFAGLFVCFAVAYLYFALLHPLA